MSDFNALKFVADNAGLNIFKALEKAYEQGKADSLGKDANVHSKSALDHIHNVVRDDAYKRGYEQGKADAKAEAISLAWIKGYIVTCDIFDLRVNVPASKVIKTMVKIWEQENPGAKEGEQHETD